MNGKRIGIGLLMTGLLAGLIFQFRQGTPSLNWSENYRAQSKDPYGTSLIYNLLKKDKNSDNFVTLDDTRPFLLPDNSVGATYLFVGKSFTPDEEQQQMLLNFVEAGNHAFISSTRLPDDFMQEIIEQQCYSGFWKDNEALLDTLGLLSVTDRKQTRYTFRQENGTAEYFWAYFSRENRCDGLPLFEELGYLNEIFPNYVRIPYGEGHFFLHTTPLAFTNYFLIEESCLAYAEKVLSFVHPGQLYWDEWTRSSESRGNNRNPSNNTDPYTISPIRYLLSHPALAWAWYILLSLGILFLIFRSKRTQRIIPLMAPPANSSLEFITTIGNLYYFQGDHKQIALLSMQSLVRFIRNRYRLPVKDTLEGLEEYIALKSGVPAALLYQIGHNYTHIETQAQLSAGELMSFHRLLENFYHNCK